MENWRVGAAHLEAVHGRRCGAAGGVGAARRVQLSEGDLRSKSMEMLAESKDMHLQGGQAAAALCLPAPLPSVVGAGRSIALIPMERQTEGLVGVTL
eukprot:jgi/Mesen1/5493/ME000276S04619